MVNLYIFNFNRSYFKERNSASRGVAVVVVIVVVVAVVVVVVVGGGGGGAIKI